MEMEITSTCARIHTPTSAHMRIAHTHTYSHIYTLSLQANGVAHEQQMAKRREARVSILRTIPAQRRVLEEFRRLMSKADSRSLERAILVAEAEDQQLDEQARVDALQVYRR